jgi:hypothetical protein
VYVYPPPLSNSARVRRQMATRQQMTEEDCTCRRVPSRHRAAPLMATQRVQRVVGCMQYYRPLLRSARARRQTATRQQIEEAGCTCRRVPSRHRAAPLMAT